MEIICNITKENEALLSNSLRSIYSSAVLYEAFEDESDFLKSVIELVESDIKYSQSLRKDPSLAYRIPNIHELAVAFIEKYQTAIDKAGKLAYSINEKYGYTVDIVSIVGPYILYQCGVTDDNLSFYLALGMTLSNIICDILANHEENNMQAMRNEETQTVCKAIYQLLEKTKKRNELHRVHDLQIEKSMKEIQKVLDKNTTE
jgi:hypothetical protein